MAQISGPNFGGAQIGHQNVSVDSKLSFRSIADWLSPINNAQKQKDVYKSEYWGSKQSFFDSADFQSWQNDQIDFLWCHGMAGSGKTVLTSLVYEHLRSIQHPTAKVGIATLYCDNQQQHIQTPENMLASLWPQLYLGDDDDDDDENLPFVIVGLYRLSMKTRTRPDLNQIEFLLQSTIQNLDQAFILIDGLDECLDTERQETILESIKAVAAASSKEKQKVRVLVTSRMADNSSGIKLIDTDDDVRYMIQKRLMQPKSFRKGMVRDTVSQNSDLRTRIVDIILSKTNGMFLIADLTLRSLASALSVTDLFTALENVPKTLENYYDTAWSRILSQDSPSKQLAINTISWLYLARRILKKEELLHALAVRFEEKAFNNESLMDLETMLEVCQGLVVEEKHSESIRLMHMTTRDYIRERQTLLLEDASVYMAKTCLTYLCFDAFEKKSFNNLLDLSLALENYPLLNYASANWGYHSSGEPEVSCSGLIMQFLSSKNALANAHKIHPQVFHPSNRQHVARGSEDLVPLRVAVSFRLERTAGCLIQSTNRAAIDKGDKMPQVPQTGFEMLRNLLEAIENGCLSVVRALLDADINPFPKFKLPKTILDCTFLYDFGHPKNALDKSVCYGHKEIAKLLIDWAFARPSVRMTVNYNYIVNADDVDTLKDLAQNAWIDDEDIDTGNTALACAVIHGQSDVVKLLLDAGADSSINYKLLEEDRICERSLLQAAVMSQIAFKQRLDFLLDHFTMEHTLPNIDNSDIASLTKRLRNWLTQDPQMVHLIDNPAFVEAIREDSEYARIIELLLDHGLDFSVREEEGESLLHLSFTKQRVNAILQYLEDNPQSNLDIDTVDLHGRTPLHYAAAACNFDVVELLVNSGADVSMRDNDGVTTLHFAVNSPRCVKLFIEQGESIHDVHKDLGTPLQFARSLEDPNNHAIKVLEDFAEAPKNLETADLSFSDATQRLPKTDSKVYQDVEEWMVKQKDSQYMLCRKNIAYRLRQSQQQAIFQQRRTIAW
ncbi:hypothetical protein ACLMJK_001919 [Lecanora helva]